MLKYLIVCITILLQASAAFAVTNVTATGVSGSGFPVALTTAAETYRLTENIACSTTCFTLKANNITIDLNGYTATFGTANAVSITDTGFENWSDANTPSDWTILGGTLTREPAQVWGSYDAILSATGSIKSNTVTLNAGQTYIYYAVVKGTSADSYTIEIIRASDDVSLASSTISSDYLNRAFAMGNGVIRATEHEFKPSANTDVYLKITGAGSSAKRIHVADIAPAKHYFALYRSYLDTLVTPDLSSGLFGGSVSTLNIVSSAASRGVIQQGAGKAVKSSALWGTGYNVSDVDFILTGNNTSAIVGYAGTLEDFSINTSSILAFNRMHPTPSIDIAAGASGATIIDNFEIYNDPCQSIRQLNQYHLDEYSHTTTISDGVIRGKEQVTEGYAIVLSGGNNHVTITRNTINPYKGRGILLDAVANSPGYLDGTRDVEIHGNSIINIYEQRTPEYGEDGLEAAGIRVRDWGEGHVGLKVYDNIISGKVDDSGTHRTYGINITTISSATTADIYNNDIDIVVNSRVSADWQSSGIAIQGVDVTPGEIDIHHNDINGSEAIRLGGNDGFIANGVDIYYNVITSDKAAIFFNAYSAEYSDNNFYCNQIINTGASGYPIYVTPTVPTMSQTLDYNSFTNANAAEVYTEQNLSTSMMFFGSGTVDVAGGGSIGTAGAATNGEALCYETAGVSETDIFPPQTSASPESGSFDSTQSVELSCYDNVGCVTTYYCVGVGCTPTTEYSTPISISSSSVLRFYSVDTLNSESIQQESYTITGDITPPVISTSVPAGRYRETQTVTLSSNETAIISYCTSLVANCTPSVTYSAPFKVLQNVALHYYCYRGTDSADNTSETVCEEVRKQRVEH